MKTRRIFIRILLSIITILILANINIIVQAYSFTHFIEKGEKLSLQRTPSLLESINIVIFGINIPKPKTIKYPNITYETLYIPTGKEGALLEAWILQTKSHKKGTVIAFHGYMDEKSSMLDRAYNFLDMGYDVLLVDFMGSGGSYGLQSTIGVLEASNVKDTYFYVSKELKEKNIILIGFSMGAAAITNAIYSYGLSPQAIILEATYGRFEGTVKKRLDRLDIPNWPISDIFTFWVGTINGFDGFKANPQEYVKEISSPILLMCGGQDPNIPIEETEYIYSQLASKNKKLKIFPLATHESYLLKYPHEWRKEIINFIDSI